MLAYRCLSLSAVIFSLVLLHGAKARAEPYRDGARHYVLELPGDWQAMTAVEVQRINQAARQITSDKAVSYEMGFRPKGRALGSYPYILVQALQVKTAGASYADLEKDLAKALNGPAVKEGEGSWGDLVKNATIGAAVLDRSRNVVLFRLQMDVRGMGKVHGLSVGHLGSEGIVFLHCYATQQEFDRLLPTFQKINESFHFDPGYTFTPGDGLSFWKNVGSGAVRGGVIGAIAGGLGALAFTLSRKRKKPAVEQPPSGEQPETPA